MLTTYNVYVRETRWSNVYDVSIPELFPDDYLEVQGAENVVPAIEQACSDILETEKFHLSFFMPYSIRKEILFFTDFSG